MKTLHVPAVDVRARGGVVEVQVRRQGWTAAGSGFVVDEQGTIVTNEHVVEDARTARIRFTGQDEPVTARVLGTGASTGLAVLRGDERRAEHVTLGTRPEEIANR